MKPIALFGIQFTMSLLVFALIAAWYVVPRLSKLPKELALVPLLWVHAFRIIGGTILAPGSVDPALQTLLNRYMQAWETNDVEALITLLKEDARFAMPPFPAWYQGRDSIRHFFQVAIFTARGAPQWRLAPTSANAQPTCVLYRLNQSTGTFSYFGLVVLTIDGDSIASSTAFIDTSLGRRYGLTLELPLTTESESQ
ncbi:MAG: nuclear transport factor 2 family protein [Ktedonobacterales bacterium]